MLKPNDTAPAAHEDPGGLYTFSDGSRTHTTNIRSLAGGFTGRLRAPGSRELAAASLILAGLAATLFAVSLNAQYRYVLAAKHVGWAAMFEAFALDAGLIIFTLLALGLSRRGLPSRTERILIMVCAVLSALMNYAASDVTSPRSVLAYVMPPVFLAICVDRLVAVVRRWVLGHDDHSAWRHAASASAATGRMLAGAGTASARLAALAALYALRTMLAPKETGTGLRLAVLNATPLPEARTRPELPAAPAAPLPDDYADPQPDLAGGETKSARLRALYDGRAGLGPKYPGHGDRAKVGQAAAELAKRIPGGMHEGQARTVLASYVKALNTSSAAATVAARRNGQQP